MSDPYPTNDLFLNLRRSMIQTLRQLEVLEDFMIQEGMLPKERKTVIVIWTKPPSETAAHTEK